MRKRRMDCLMVMMMMRRRRRTEHKKDGRRQMLYRLSRFQPKVLPKVLSRSPFGANHAALHELLPGSPRPSWHGQSCRRRVQDGLRIRLRGCIEGGSSWSHACMQARALSTCANGAGVWASPVWWTLKPSRHSSSGAWTCLRTRSTKGPPRPARA
ncbi:hypothetical protein BD289DRAFT_236394 [Coniella lustricola]|uniref:Uncharacterized protein n=1 Tax=Coniella lustricola TaxID=2025994 RepID=A0A2T3A9Q9_9PEZI|nr:hypothetical protein BD289DRAFT_236394 [Coniella lustricola]